LAGKNDLENSVVNINEAASERWLKRGVSLLDDESYEDALDSFRRAYELNPDSVDAIHYLAQELFMQGDAQEAEKLLRHGLEVKPTTGIYRTLAAILMDDPERVGQINNIIRTVREDLNDEKIADLVEGHFRIETNDGERAAELFQRVLDSEPDNDEAEEGLARALNLIGINLSEAGHNEEAMFVFRKAIGLDPWCSAPHVNLGNCFCATGKNIRARRSYQRGIELEPDNPQAHFNLARLLVDESEFGTAESEFFKVLDIDPGYSDVHAELGRLYSLQGRFDLAIRNYEKELESNPDCVPCVCNLAIAYICTGEFDSGERLLKKALDIEEDPFTLYTLAGLYASLNRDLDSISLLERAATLRPSWLCDYLRSDEKFNNIRANPRFAEMLESLVHASS
jgi:tetratricopeptide (TPR) repeat protein